MESQNSYTLADRDQSGRQLPTTKVGRQLDLGGSVDRDNHHRISVIILVGGALISSGLGVFFYFRTDLSAALATFAGLIGTTVTLQIEVLLRSKQTRELETRGTGGWRHQRPEPGGS